MVPLFTQSFEPVRNVWWMHFFRIHESGTNILHHPDFEPNGRSHIIYDDPVLDVSTGAYKVCEWRERGGGIRGVVG